VDARRRPQPITIGVAGTHSTGKTTFLHRVQSELERSGRRVETVGQIAARARVVGFPILDQHTAASTLWVITRGISEELEAGPGRRCRFGRPARPGRARLLPRRP
jgi:nucleoside-triphosphatase THEP1